MGKLPYACFTNTQHLPAIWPIFKRVGPHITGEKLLNILTKIYYPSDCFSSPLKHSINGFPHQRKVI